MVWIPSPTELREARLPGLCPAHEVCGGEVPGVPLHVLSWGLGAFDIIGDPQLCSEDLAGLCTPAKPPPSPWVPCSAWEGKGLSWAQRPEWARLGSGPGVKASPHSSEPQPLPLQMGMLQLSEASPPCRASSGHRDTSLFPKKILLNVHTRFILGFANSIQQVKRQQCPWRTGHQPPAQPPRLRGGLHFPQAAWYLLSYTLPQALPPCGGCFVPRGAQESAQDGWIWNPY